MTAVRNAVFIYFDRKFENSAELCQKQRQLYVHRPGCFAATLNVELGGGRETTILIVHAAAKCSNFKKQTENVS